MPRTVNLNTHPMREQIVDEMHLRRMPPLPSPCRMLQVVLLVRPEDREREQERVGTLAGREGHVFPRHGRGRRKSCEWLWERHSEASTYTLICHGKGAVFSPEGFEEELLAWLEQAPGQVVRAVQVVVDEDEKVLVPAVSRLEAEDTISVRNGALGLWSDFRIHEDGWGRLVIASGGTHPADLGRWVQRVQELGNYRNLALLTLPLVRSAGERLDALEARLVDVSRRLARIDGDGTTLEELSRISAATVALDEETGFRRGAMQAYARIVADRLGELSSEPVEGYQGLEDFIARRFTPAVRTCEAFSGRLERLAVSVERSTALLRTRIDMRLQSQNHVLLTSMRETGARQLRLQHMVEGLSVVAVSYYVFGLVNIIIKPGVKYVGAQQEMVAAVLLVPIVLVVWGYLRWRVRRVSSSSA
ncbi:DUF3422 domain-containing protein [Brevundimonas sp.]|jgi:uncharacterized membrane-anchored protein|uniref:DUF3422 domain-containing protein n=1 Tax=Brevundimonas sp. TaxID=1871086 RepID=UPI0017CEAF4B|nr:DUF3422 domain-containing protein [Brevundimonas sp.]MBA4806917.1 DUF3422 domain-containing protein [Brevundimonas sp.]